MIGFMPVAISDHHYKIIGGQTNKRWRYYHDISRKKKKKKNKKIEVRLVSF